jgi:hypothetical protein
MSSSDVCLGSLPATPLSCAAPRTRKLLRLVEVLHAGPRARGSGGRRAARADGAPRQAHRVRREVAERAMAVPCLVKLHRLRTVRP